MFIPRGKVIHENLATSYVLVDALVADLCEGGFSGVVEVGLREADGYIIIAGGTLAAIIETEGDTFIRTDLGRLAEQSRLQRGRISVYAYSKSTAEAIAGRINAQTLYAGLSAEFTDLEKMIWKLAREREREWFVEINTNSGIDALLHMRDGGCRIITSTADASEEESDSVDLLGNSSLGRLVYECNRAGGTFDVCFKRPADATMPSFDQAYGRPPAASAQLEVGASVKEAAIDDQAAEPIFPNELVTSDLEPDPEGDRPASAAIRQPDPEAELIVADFNALGAAAAASTPHHTDSPDIPVRDEVNGGPALLADSLNEAEFQELTLDGNEIRVSSDEALEESKRLMGEIARTVEEAAQAVGRPDSFPMSLRAGQLKIAERYPFLDPFAGDFEYLGGEIVFVGQASAEEFTAGLTEALKLAVRGVAQSSAYADRFRSYLAEDLQKLSARNRADLERFGLDQVINEILRC